MSEKTSNDTAVAERCVRTPRVDIKENEGEVVLHADLPGVAARSIEVTLEHDMLVVRGDVEPIAAEGYRLLHREGGAERFERSFRLSGDLDRDRIDASFEKGVLRLTIARKDPKRTVAIRTA